MPVDASSPAAESPSVADEPKEKIDAELTVGANNPKQPKQPKQPKEELSPEEKAARREWLAEVCPIGEPEGSGTWLDRSQDRLGWSVCRATLWFDGLFGDERAIVERDATYGYLEPRIEWSEYDGVEPRLRVRAKINLPVADRRLNALLGRSGDDDGLGSGSDVAAEPLPDSFTADDEEWLVGLGYTPVRGSRKRLDLDGGVKLDSPVEFFVQGRFRRHWFLSPRNLVRARQSTFWRSDDGLGVQLYVDFERSLRGPYVARWRNKGTYAQEGEGVDWFEELTFFQRLGEKSAVAWVLSVNGETDDEVPVHKWSAEMVYRRTFLREWLFVELRPGIDWRRRETDLNREIEPFLGVGLQLHFGDANFE